MLIMRPLAGQIFKMIGYRIGLDATRNFLPKGLFTVVAIFSQQILYEPV
jgi:hypothetical protein